MALNKLHINPRAQAAWVFFTQVVFNTPLVQKHLTIRVQFCGRNKCMMKKKKKQTKIDFS